jgi:membrane protein implicated in regulation of membrane protease activity
MAKPSEPGDIVRYEEAERPLHAAVVITILTFLELVFVVLVIGSLVAGWDSPQDQILQAQWLFAIFMILGFILMIYRRYFLPDVMVVKVRNKKYEDFIDKTRIPRQAK